MLSEHKIYEGIFNIFEIELEEISHFVAFTDANMDVYSNKIHELHLRVCSEIENLLKIIIHKHFTSQDKVEESWETHKKLLLEKKDVVADYKNIQNKLNGKERKNVDQWLFGHPDFLFYFKLACEKFNLDKKVVNFKAIISHPSSWNEIHSFKIESGNSVPTWWTNYNKLKHDKINNYGRCKLRDLIYSTSGMFVLINYLLKYQENNYPIKNSNYVHFCQSGMLPYINSEFCSFSSRLFEASVSYQLFELSILLPLSIDTTTHDDTKIDDFYINQNFSCRDLFKNKTLKDIDLKSLKDINFKSFEYTSSGKSYSESIFYTYVDYQLVADLQRVNFWKLGHFGIFSN